METYVVHVTKECNCNCLYCYEDDKTSKYTWKEIKEFLDNLIKYATSKEFHIEFLGGEPMLKWDYIKKVYNYIEKERKDVRVSSYTITTNGTIMDEEIAKYLKENPKLHFAISMDGHAYANQFRIFKDGVNTYNKVMENIKILQKNDIDFGIHIVSHLYNIAFLSESIFHLYSKGVKSIDVGTIEKTMKIDEEYCNRFIKELDIVSQKIVDGTYPDLHIGLFGWVKPKEDIRSYIRDSTGKVVGESYGRSGEDITHKDVYNTLRCTQQTPISEMIYYIRKTVYDNHQIRLIKKRQM
ncbi:MAG: radical SAM protein [Candidatus Nanoarchaeia archaeon]|nr:radical SAM protein [Candidatus Nanoarchaeia archaeon]